MTTDPAALSPANETPAARKVHALSRSIEGHVIALDLPLCWDMEGKQRGATDDGWWISADHEAIDFTELVFAQRPLVTCPDCLEWMHA